MANADTTFQHLLGAFRRRLVVRHLLRLALTGWVVFAVAATVSLLIVVLLPWIVLDFHSPMSWVLSGVVSVGCGVLAIIRQHVSLPTVTESALAAEGRLEESNGVISSAIATQGVFRSELVRQAEGALGHAMKRPAPALFTLRQLIAAPVLTLLLALLLIPSTSFQSKALAESLPKQTDIPATASSWNAIDTGSERTSTDASAVAKAKGLKESAASLHEAAKKVRNATSKEDTQKALDSAREQAKESTGDLPETAPEGETEREKLARKIETIADGMSAKAKNLAVENGIKGTQDSGNDVTAEPDETPRSMIEMPKFEHTPRSLSAYAGLTPARRTLAIRAVKLLEETQE
ncbi:hypothetical protein OAU50_01125 [Planctomycetota bacterium]|nr:hypothetical protein [Planctomycetota bacterium]